MKTRFFIILFASVLLFSCKNEQKNTDEATENIENNINDFKVTLNVTIKKDDTFSLFYTQDGSIDFKDQPIWMNVKGSDSPQEVVFIIPEEIYPTQLRIDLGINSENSEIVLNKVKMEVNGKVREMIGAEIGNFFRADENKCTFDPATGIVKPLNIDGNITKPSLYPQEVELGVEIKKLFGEIK